MLQENWNIHEKMFKCVLKIKYMKLRFFVYASDVLLCAKITCMRIYGNFALLLLIICNGRLKQSMVYITSAQNH